MPRSGFDAVLLVTGFPSVYARALVRHILAAEPGSFVNCVVPADQMALAQSEALRLSPPELGRLVLIEGDPSAMDLGLSGLEFRALTGEVDVIHHAAHTDSWISPRKEAYSANVVSAAEILEFAREAPNLRSLVFHSTAHVSGQRTGIVFETDLAADQSFHRDAEETRMQAEVLVRRAMAELPIAVVRPTALVGDLEVDDERILDGIHLLVLLILATPGEIALPFASHGDTPLNIVPLDYVVRAAHAIGQSPDARGRTFHLADPQPLSAGRVAELIARASGKRTVLSPVAPSVARALLRAPGIERFVRSPRAFVDQLTTGVRYDTRNTKQLLGETDIQCPSFETYVEALTTAVQGNLKARQRRREAPPVGVRVEVDDPLR